MRLLHAKEQGSNFREDFDKYPVLVERLERVLCPRVHFKMIVFDLEIVYVGSANLTGAGIGMKTEHKRNFEVGVLTNDPTFVESAINQFDFVWNGRTSYKRLPTTKPNMICPKYLHTICKQATPHCMESC